MDSITILLTLRPQSPKRVMSQLREQAHQAQMIDYNEE